MTKFLQILACTVGFLAGAVLLWACRGYQSGEFALEKAVALLTLGAVLGLTGVFFALFYILWQRPLGSTLLVMFVAAVAGLVSFYLPYQHLQLTRALPPIHDISTDTRTPPTFLALSVLGNGAARAAIYDAERDAPAQAAAYPDLRPVVFAHPPATVLRAVEAQVKASGWQLIQADASRGILEAVATSRWLKAKADVVIRLQAGSSGSTVLDMRSRSREAVPDAGANARRIRTFIAALRTQLP
jgi:uncharacterized protein (DUF1499 family)